MGEGFFMFSISRARQLLTHVLPGVIRPLRVLWNQIIGFLFVVLAGLAVPSALRSFREFKGDAESFFRVILTGLFILVMAGFGVSSFLRAHKVSKKVE
jgi:hypothetical protein